MAAAEVIVVAPDEAFRHSLVFVLESGDFSVLPYGSLAAGFASHQVHDAQCAVVDEEAIDSWVSARLLFKSFARPVILLANPLRATPEAPFVTCLVKPFLGKPLLEAVQQAVTGDFGPTT